MFPFRSSAFSSQRRAAAGLVRTSLWWECERSQQKTANSEWSYGGMSFQAPSTSKKHRKDPIRNPIRPRSNSHTTFESRATAPATSFTNAEVSWWCSIHRHSQAFIACQQHTTATTATAASREVTRYSWPGWARSNGGCKRRQSLTCKPSPCAWIQPYWHIECVVNQRRLFRDCLWPKVVACWILSYRSSSSLGRWWRWHAFANAPVFAIIEVSVSSLAKFRSSSCRRRLAAWACWRIPHCRSSGTQTFCAAERRCRWTRACLCAQVMPKLVSAWTDRLWPSWYSHRRLLTIFTSQFDRVAVVFASLAEGQEFETLSWSCTAPAKHFPRRKWWSDQWWYVCFSKSATSGVGSGMYSSWEFFPDYWGDTDTHIGRKSSRVWWGHWRET